MLKYFKLKYGGWVTGTIVLGCYIVAVYGLLNILFKLDGRNIIDIYDWVNPMLGLTIGTYFCSRV